MLNLSCIRTLANRQLISDYALRTFLRLFGDYDLTHWCVITAGILRRRYKIPLRDAARILNSLIRTGLLIPGPPTRAAWGTRKATTVPTYRVDPVYLLSKPDMIRWFQDIEDQRQREGIFPPEVLAKLKRQKKETRDLTRAPNS